MKRLVDRLVVAYFLAYPVSHVLFRSTGI